MDKYLIRLVDSWCDITVIELVGIFKELRCRSLVYIVH